MIIRGLYDKRERKSIKTTKREVRILEKKIYFNRRTIRWITSKKFLITYTIKESLQEDPRESVPIIREELHRFCEIRREIIAERCNIILRNDWRREGVTWHSRTSCSVTFISSHGPCIAHDLLNYNRRVYRTRLLTTELTWPLTDSQRP